jgi:PAS domain S-box-containing protein
MKGESTESLLHELDELRRKNAELVGRMDEARRVSQAHLSNALEIARAGQWEYDVATDTFTFSDALYRVYRTTAREVGGYSMRSAEYAKRFCHPDDAAHVAREISLSLETNDPEYSRQLEHRILYSDGEVGQVAVRYRIVKDAAGRTVKTYGVNQDITEYKRAEEKLALSERMFRSLFMSMSEGFYLSEVVRDGRGEPCDYRFLEVNPRFEQTLGLPRDLIIGRRYTELVPVDTTGWLPNYLAVARSGIPRTFEFYSPEYKRHFQTYCYTPAPDQVVVFVMDVTERRKLEDQLRQAQKMEAVGLLAGGIAHDFNNLLTAILGYGDLLESGLLTEDPLREYVREIMSASRKAVDLTRNLLAFSRKQPLSVRPVSVNDTVAGALNLLRRLVTEDVSIRTVLSPERPVIMADPTQIDQILLNLASNASDAMPAGGTIVIETGRAELGEEFHQAHGFGAPGSYARLSVSDTGTGMDEETVRRIFDPFFTLKEPGKGTGLGLSTVYGIVKQHGGYITVESAPGAGATFTLYFPAAREGTAPPAPEAGAARGGTEVILIAEDDAPVRRLMAEVLTRRGYRVVEAADGVEAVELFRSAGRVDLLILDSVMPGKNGRETYNEIHGSAPDVTVLFTSGHAQDLVMDKGVEEGRFRFIPKPVRPADLLRAVRDALDLRPPA